MIAMAPASETIAPAAAARGNGSRSNAAPSTMMKIGVSEFRIEPLVALVYCSPQYCSTLCSPPPRSPSRTMGFQPRASSVRCAHSRGATSGAIRASAIAQRQKVSATGGTRPASARPAIQLPDQNSAASVSSR